MQCFGPVIVPPVHFGAFVLMVLACTQEGMRSQFTSVNCPLITRMGTDLACIGYQDPTTIRDIFNFSCNSLEAWLKNRSRYTYYLIKITWSKSYLLLIVELPRGSGRIIGVWSVCHVIYLLLQGVASPEGEQVRATARPSGLLFIVRAQLISLHFYFFLLAFFYFFILF